MSIIEYVSDFLNFPKEYIMQKMWERKVREDFRIFRDVPKEYITQEMCENVVKKNSNMLRDVPEEYITREMSLKAVKDDVKLSMWIPEKYYQDAEFVELRRCKGSKGDNDLCDDEEDIECLGNCYKCHKVVCPYNSTECNGCSDSGCSDYGV